MFGIKITGLEWRPHIVSTAGRMLNGRVNYALVPIAWITPSGPKFNDQMIGTRRHLEEVAEAIEALPEDERAEREDIALAHVFSQVLGVPVEKIEIAPSLREDDALGGEGK